VGEFWTFATIFRKNINGLNTVSYFHVAIFRCLIIFHVIFHSPPRMLLMTGNRSLSDKNGGIGGLRAAQTHGKNLVFAILAGVFLVNFRASIQAIHRYFDAWIRLVVVQVQVGLMDLCIVRERCPL